MSLTINTMPVSVLVKEATQRQHTRVEELLLPRLSSLHSVTDYAAILKMFYGYYRPLESSIAQHITPQHLPDINERRKASAALHDLQVLGQPTDNIALCLSLPEINNTAQAFGTLYVLEGSTLGGKMIAKMLLKNPQLHLTEDAVTFFSVYKEETGSRWKSFLEVFNQQPEAVLIIEQANETFYHLKCWMQQVFSHE